MKRASKALAALAVALAVLDVPQQRVDRLQLGEQRRIVGLAGQFARLDGFKKIELHLHIGQLGRVGDPLALQAQDGDLVEQLAGGDGNQDHRGLGCVAPAAFIRAPAPPRKGRRRRAGAA